MVAELEIYFGAKIQIFVLRYDKPSAKEWYFSVTLLSIEDLELKVAYVVKPTL